MSSIGTRRSISISTYLGDHADWWPGSALLIPIIVTEAEGGEGVVRTALCASEQDKSITFAGDNPQRGTARFMKTNMSDLVDGATDGAEASLIGLEEVTRCRIEKETEAIRDVFGADTSIAGICFYGELCRFSQRGEGRLHDQIKTIAALAEA
jgi:hypothetical protein